MVGGPRGGRARLTPAGGFRFTGTESVTEMGCAGEDPGWAVVQVARVELDASVLLLLDADGVELARLSRSGESD